MTTKEQLLELLENKKGDYVSGEEIASSLSVSRAAIWKAIEALRADGYEIEALRRKGYCLAPDSDRISETGIRRYLRADARGKDIESGIDLEVRQSVTSTNNILKEQAAAGSPEGTVLVAANQTAGKGRVGRSFYSPGETGVYLSILLRPTGWDAARASSLTTMAAVAACEAIEELLAHAGQDHDTSRALIKWVNDVYVRGRKVCGILTEAGLDLESGALEYAVLGIGFNVYEPVGGFPEEIRDRAGAILQGHIGDGKNCLAAAFIRRFFSYYRGEKEGFGGAGDQGASPAGAGAYIRAYQDRSFVIGHLIDVIAGGESRKATALAVDDDCHLLVEYEDGGRENLSSGEVSIRV